MLFPESSSGPPRNCTPIHTNLNTASVCLSVPLFCLSLRICLRHFQRKADRRLAQSRSTMATSHFALCDSTKIATIFSDWRARWSRSGFISLSAPSKNLKVFPPARPAVRSPSLTHWIVKYRHTASEAMFRSLPAAAWGYATKAPSWSCIPKEPGIGVFKRPM